MAGARPVFADIDPDRLTIDPEAVASAVTSRTRAILPVHLYGQAADMASLQAIAARHQPGHRRRLLPGPPGDGRRPARRHDRRRRRLQLLSDEEPRSARRRRRRRHQRRARSPTASGGCRNGGQTDRYHHQEPGINSRLDEMQAAILRARLPSPGRLDRQTARAGRRPIARRSQTAPVDRPARTRSRPRLSSVRRPDRSSARSRRIGRLSRRDSPRAASKRSCTTRCRFRSSRRSRRPGPADCPRATAACDDALSLPLHPGLTEARRGRWWPASLSRQD